MKSAYFVGASYKSDVRSEFYSIKAELLHLFPEEDFEYLYNCTVSGKFPKEYKDFVNDWLTELAFLNHWTAETLQKVKEERWSREGLENITIVVRKNSHVG